MSLEEKENLNEIVKDTGDNNIIPDETLDNTSNNNFETKVKRRNAEAKKAKEELENETEEEEQPKTKSFLKTVLAFAGIGLIGVGLFGAFRTQKQPQNTQISQDEGMSNENI
ncbi:hypothetical protein AMRN_1425 [Malaciobacter marinus]|uniref:Uncharacterized protein n=1 Tax=Malaciobacter marinus TaxID=505249 RepID=A0A347TKN3_9BACT|nr:hypothetical protein [Malaciobacter marinus]AXX87161.1 hypothetical protein AMRN_1425 [Malaciobacter marinus]PHO14824.1 hypothetical protein CPH92_09565 [Malaciobacter marinus]